MTTSCDAGVRVDLSCDSCDAPFTPWASTPEVPALIWADAMERGWSSTGPAPGGRHFCPECAAGARRAALAAAAAATSS